MSRQHPLVERRAALVERSSALRAELGRELQASGLISGFERLGNITKALGAHPLLALAAGGLAVILLRRRRALTRLSGVIGLVKTGLGLFRLFSRTPRH